MMKIQCKNCQKVHSLERCNVRYLPCSCGASIVVAESTRYTNPAIVSLSYIPPDSPVNKLLKETLVGGVLLQHWGNDQIEVSGVSNYEAFLPSDPRGALEFCCAYLGMVGGIKEGKTPVLDEVLVLTE